VIAGQAQVRGISPKDLRRAMLERSPLKRMTRAEDIAALAVFLCSDQARNLSGQCIAVNAGEPAGEMPVRLARPASRFRRRDRPRGPRARSTEAGR
jgi:enoyl-[acyl-carrier-protein] reductase (NADH)